MTKIFRLPTSLGMAAAIVMSAAVVKAAQSGAAQPATVAANPNPDVQSLGKVRSVAWSRIDNAKASAEAGRVTGAVDELLDVAAMGRRVGQTPLAINKLVEIGIVTSTLEELTTLMPQLPHDVASKLPGRFARLPKSATLAETIAGEYDYALRLVKSGESPGWTENDVLQAKPFYDEIARAASLTPEQFAAAVDAAVAKVPEDQPFPRNVAPALKPLRVPMARLESLEQDLIAACRARADQ
jgi:hypothetical protein